MSSPDSGPDSGIVSELSEKRRHVLKLAGGGMAGAAVSGSTLIGSVTAQQSGTCFQVDLVQIGSESNLRDPVRGTNKYNDAGELIAWEWGEVSNEVDGDSGGERADNLSPSYSNSSTDCDVTAGSPPINVDFGAHQATADVTANCTNDSGVDVALVTYVPNTCNDPSAPGFDGGDQELRTFTLQTVADGTTETLTVNLPNPSAVYNVDQDTEYPASDLRTAIETDASSGDTIQIRPDTYTLGSTVLTVDTADITIRSETDRPDGSTYSGQTLLQGEGDDVIDLNPSSDRATLRGLRVDSASPGGGSLFLAGGVDQTIQNCVIDGSGHGDAAIFSGIADGLTVRNTEVIAGSRGINYRGDDASTATNLTVDQCLIRGASGPNAERNVWLIDTENATVTNSVIENSADAGVGIESFDGDTYDVSTVRFENCNIQNNLGSGMFTGGGGPATGPVDAENNWWGDSSGPGGDGPGSGNGVFQYNGSIDFDPFENSPVSDAGLQ